MPVSGRTIALFVGTLLSALSLASSTHGFRYRAVFGYLALALILASLPHLASWWARLQPPPSRFALLLRASFVALAAAQLARFHLIYVERPRVALVILAATLAVAVIGVLQMMPASRALSDRARRFAVPCLVGLMAVAVLLVPVASPRPKIDVFVFQQQGAAALMSGQNPYRMAYTNVYGRPMPWYPDGEPTVQPYPPLSLLLGVVALPAGDVRFVLALCHLLAAFLVWSAARARKIDAAEALLLAGLFVWAPGVLFEIEQAWTDTGVVLALALCSYLWATHKIGPTLLAAGAAVALKQNMGVLLPVLAALKPRLSARHFALLALPLVVTCGPFALADGAALYRSLVSFHLATPFRADANTLSTVLFRLTGEPLPAVATLVAVLALLAWWLPRLFRQAERHAFDRPALACLLWTAFASTFLSTLLVSKHAFYNYFYLVHFTVVLALVWSRAADVEGVVKDGLACARGRRRPVDLWRGRWRACS
ncbi:MAG: hypothetical protein HY903_13240 [Deltaproteobacteria bacterium]|nr:hypothetical protein [Deltaproteobacteria bacterium]